MADKKEITFHSYGWVSLIGVKHQDNSVIYYDAKTRRNDPLVVMEYQSEEDYKATREKVTRIGSAYIKGVCRAEYATYVTEQFIAKEPVSYNYPIEMSAWKDVSVQLKACLQLAKVFDEISSRLYVIKRFNTENLGVDPTTGNISLDMLDCIERNDTFQPEMMNGSRYVLSAEEINDVQHAPIDSAGYTLAVLLFEILVGCHPFEGRRIMTKSFLNDSDLDDNYGPGRVFIFDPENGGNAPVPGIQSKVVKAWNVIPEEFKNAFVMTFSKKEIISPKDWIQIIEKYERAEDSLFTCPNCARETYIKIGEVRECLWCGTVLEARFILKQNMGGKTTPLIEGADLVPNSFTKRVVGKVLRNNGKLMIKNTTRQTWQAFTPSNVEKQVAPDSFMPVNNGIKVRIDTYEYTIEQIG